MKPEAQQTQEVFAKADAALSTGQITREQRDALLIHYYGTPDLRQALAPYDETHAFTRSTMLVIAFSIFMLSMFGLLLYTGGGVTGAAVLDQNTTYTNGTSIPLALNAATRINVSGTASGVGNILITLVGDQNYTLYNYSHGAYTTAHASIPKTWYSPGEAVTYTATGVSSAYLMPDAMLLNDTTITNLSEGNYSIRLLINDTEETLPFTVSSSAPSDAFNTCGEACGVNLTGNYTIIVAVDGGSLALDQVAVSTEGNRPPQLVQSIPDMNGVGQVQVNASAYFSDEDPLLYDSSRHAGMAESFNGSVLTVSGPAGTYAYIIYASDLHDITPSNIFTVTIADNMTATNENVTNTTSAVVVTNTTINITSNTTNVSQDIPSNISLDCSSPDPNKRPPECLLENASAYFPQQDIFWQDLDRNPVARFTVIGNLLIRGDVIQNSTGQPGPRDFRIGYSDIDGNPVATVWIDTDGNLHLRGSLHEENNNLQPPPGSYSLLTRRSIYLTYADVNTGDLYLRGNLIPYRRSIT